MDILRSFYIISFTLFLTLQYSLLFSENSYFSFKNTLETYESIISDIKNVIKTNDILRSEIKDLEIDKESIEIYAREKYGYIKKNESFIQIIKNDQ